MWMRPRSSFGLPKEVTPSQKATFAAQFRHQRPLDRARLARGAEKSIEEPSIKYD